jgi:hypothetical protein
VVYPGTLFHRRQRGIPMHSYENRSQIRALHRDNVHAITDASISETCFAAAMRTSGREEGRPAGGKVQQRTVPPSSRRLTRGSCGSIRLPSASMFVSVDSGKPGRGRCCHFVPPFASAIGFAIESRTGETLVPAVPTSGQAGGRRGRVRGQRRVDGAQPGHGPVGHSRLPWIQPIPCSSAL